MSKFLKIIVNIFLVLAILIAAAILVPPLLGIKTTIVDSEAIETNLPMGSITYSRDISAADVKAGDKILKEDGSQIYSYRVVSGDATTGTVRAVSSTDPSAAETDVTVRGMISKVVLTVPLIGFVVVAMHSMEGIIIVGLVVLLMIILFILSELWKPVPDDEEEEEEEEETEERNEAPERRYAPEEMEREPFPEINQDEETAASVAEILKENAARAESVAEETAEIAAAPAAVTQEMPVIREEIPAAQAGIPVPEKAAETVAAAVIAETAAVSEAAAEAPAAAVSEERTLSREKPQSVQKSTVAEAVQPAETETGQIALKEEIPEETAAQAAEEEPAIMLDDPDAFIPISRPSVESLLEEAAKAGEKAKVIRDETTGVTLIDYSEIL